MNERDAVRVRLRRLLRECRVEMDAIDRIVAELSQYAPALEDTAERPVSALVAVDLAGDGE